MSFARLKPIVVIFSLAMILRIFFLFAYNHGKFLKDEISGSDEVVYSTIADNFSSGKGFVIDSIYARRTPVYPLFLAVVYSLTKHSVVAVRVAQCFLGAFSCLLLYFIATQIFKEKVGLIAGVICAVDYSMLQLSAYLVSETLYIFLFLFAFLFFLLYYRYKNSCYIVFSGILFGLTSLCRELAVFMLFITAVWMVIFINGALKVRIKPAAIFIIFALIVIAPWVLRNYRIYHRIIPFTVSSGHSLYLGNNEHTPAWIGGYENPSWNMPLDVSNFFTPETDELLKKKALRFMAENPKRSVIYAKDKLINMWQPYYSDSRLLSKVVMSILYPSVLVCGLLGLLVTLAKSKISLLVIFSLVFYTLVHIFTISGIRYRYPLMPFLMIYAAYILNMILEFLIYRRRGAG
ncbi:MAG: glycosyltransferase family 39 protein [Candidatus Omnitrophica bacterium]|nr:glycosyltransferase family 39 protein [Candidatus Omnitrophota bacterium]MBU1870165.1 glycosyltransferase family 39 protein [Candidatus Omnitrophota bacterium]